MLSIIDKNITAAQLLYYILFYEKNNTSQKQRKFDKKKSGCLFKKYMRVSNHILD